MGRGVPLIGNERVGAGSMGSVGSTGSTGAVRRIKIKKRRGVLEYMVFTKDEKPVNLLNLLTYEDSYKG